MTLAYRAHKASDEAFVLLLTTYLIRTSCQSQPGLAVLTVIGGPTIAPRPNLAPASTATLPSITRFQEASAVPMATVNRLQERHARLSKTRAGWWFDGESGA
jgi:hypothetical protein